MDCPKNVLCFGCSNFLASVPPQPPPSTSAKTSANREDIHRGDALQRASPPHSVRKPMKPPATSCNGYPSAFVVTSRTHFFFWGGGVGRGVFQKGEGREGSKVGKDHVFFRIIGSHQNMNKDHMNAREVPLVWHVRTVGAVFVMKDIPFRTLVGCLLRKSPAVWGNFDGWWNIFPIHRNCLFCWESGIQTPSWRHDPSPLIHMCKRPTPFPSSWGTWGLVCSRLRLILYLH